MRRVALAALALLAAGGLAGCGSKGVIEARPQTVVGSVPTVSSTAQNPGQFQGGTGTQTTAGKSGPTAAPPPAAKLKGNPAKGKGIFASNGCTSCHTLKAAGSSGTVGPNLDQAKPSYQLATDRVTNGKGVMPSFKGRLTAQQIADVAAFVVKSTGGQTP